MIQRIFELAANRNRWMLTIFLCYVAFVFVFGAVYYFIDQRNHQAFAFNTDIVRAQSNSVRLESNQRMLQLASELSNLYRLKQELANTDSKTTLGLEFGGLFITSTIRCIDAQFTVIGMPKKHGQQIALRVSSLDDKVQIEIVGKPYYEFPVTKAGLRELINTWIADWEADQEQIHIVLNSLKTDSPEIWSYWDFLYFSAITQFTVGYGDILPNSTPVRLVVILQTCIAAALLVVVINVASTTPKS